MTGSVPVLTLVAMGTATTLIGVLPTYATIGVAAPILLILLRLIQGAAVGGEWGGAVLISVEHAPKNRRGFCGSFAQIGLSSGLVLANRVFVILSVVMTREQFSAWGWWIPFLLSAVLVIIGFWIRSRVDESPGFAARVDFGATVRMPIVTVLRTHWRQVLLGTALCSGITAMAYIAAVYSVSFGTAQLGFSPTFVLVAVLIAALVEIPATLWFAAVSDRLGRAKVVVWGAVAAVVVGLLICPCSRRGGRPSQCWRSWWADWS